MATLEKIRSKSVLLLIIIAVALLAFILGDFFTSGRTLFGTGTTIAKVDGEKIDVQDFQRRLEEANQQAQQSGRKVDSAVLQQQVLQTMIAETLFKEEMKKLGITVTDQELTDIMLGENSQMFNQMIQQQTGIESGAVLYDMAFNPSKYGIDDQQAAVYRNFWLTQEKQMEEQLLNEKFGRLFMGTLVANDLDAKALYDDNAETSHIAYAKKDYSSLDDKKYEATDDEISNLWKERQNRYILDEPTRLVEYISVEIAPSQADLQAGQKKVEEALAALKEKEGTTGLEGMNEFVVERQNYTRGMLRDNALKSFADSATIGSARLISQNGNEYTLAKLLGSKTDVDSVNIDFLSIQGSRAQVDSILNLLNNGGDFASVAAGPLVANKQDSTWVSLVDPQFAQVRTILETATVGTFFTPDTIAEGGRIFRVRNRKAPVTVYDIATASFVNEAGAATINNLQAELDKFLKANPTAEAFTKNAPTAGYTVLNATVTPSSPIIGNLPESHNAVAWALDAKKGQVSPVFGDQVSGRFIAVAVEDVYNNGFVPATNPQVREDLARRVSNNKKAADLIAQYKGKAKNITDYAKLMGSSVDSTTVTFGQPMIPNLGFNESELTAAVVAAKPGQVSEPVQGNNAVIVFVVNNVDKNQRPFNNEESAIQFNQQRGAGALSRNIVNILKGKKKVENRIPTFYK